jgi:hypothetical protein
MKYISNLPRALSVPFSALFFSTDPNFKPERYDVVVWYVIATILLGCEAMSDVFKLGRGIDWEIYLGLAVAAALLCRLAIVERELRELRKASSAKSRE